MLLRINNEFADIWLVSEDGGEHKTYCYGGTRSVPVKTDDQLVENILNYLGKYESGVKNKLINNAIREGVFNKFSDRIPEQFYQSNVGGGRCVFRPKNEDIEAIIDDPRNEKFEYTINSILKSVGGALNQFDGELKLTPDFGRFAGVADSLHEYTEHVLGIRCEDGGCGGKASYTSTGINAAIEYFLEKKGRDSRIVLIGADGACGVGVFDYLLAKKYNLIGVSDLNYTDVQKHGIPVLGSQTGKFTDECLINADIIVATTVGDEFLNTNLDAINDGTIVLLAHNHCLPIDARCVELINKMSERNILVLPGQFLTFGGALTSRIEWFWRLCHKGYFDKQLAHDAVYHMEKQLLRKMYDKTDDVNPLELILSEKI